MSNVQQNVRNLNRTPQRSLAVWPRSRFTWPSWERVQVPGPGSCASASDEHPRMLPCPTALQPPQAGAARTKDEDPNAKQTRDGYAMGYLCARPDVENNEEYKTTQNHREILVASTRIHGRRSSNNPCKYSIYTSGRIMRVTKRPILPSQERTCLRLFRSAILSHCLRKDTYLPAKLKAQHVPYHTI